MKLLRDQGSSTISGTMFAPQRLCLPAAAGFATLLLPTALHNAPVPLSSSAHAFAASTPTDCALGQRAVAELMFKYEVRRQGVEGQIGELFQVLERTPFADGNVERFHFQIVDDLRQVISDPLRTIHQGEKSTCTATTFLTQLILDDPLRVMKAITELLITGRSDFGSTSCSVTVNSQVVTEALLPGEVASGTAIDSYLQRLVQAGFMDYANDSLVYSYLSDDHWATEHGVPTFPFGIRGLVFEDVQRLAQGLGMGTVVRLPDNSLERIGVVETQLDATWQERPEPFLATLAWAGASKFEGMPHAVLVLEWGASEVIVRNPTRSPDQPPPEQRIQATLIDRERQIWSIRREVFCDRVIDFVGRSSPLNQFACPKPD